MFGVPMIPAALAMGGVWKRIAWYAGTAVLVLLSLVATDVIYSGPHPTARVVAPLSVNFLMVALTMAARKSR
jgi:hypothetical protein